MSNQNTRGNNDTPHDGGDAPTERRTDVHATDLTRFQLDQLAVIARLDATECYGIAIEKALAAYHDESIHHPRNYENLDALVEDGLVAKGDHDGRTNQYELTECGRELLVERAQWLADQLGFELVDATDQEPRPDGGKQCVNCGACLPEEIEDDTGVYCSECGHGQHVTDGGDPHSEFCSGCTQRVALEDRTTHDGMVYHAECAPDDIHTTGGDA